MVILNKPANHVVSYSSVNPNKLTYGNMRGGEAIGVTTTGD